MPSSKHYAYENVDGQGSREETQSTAMHEVNISGSGGQFNRIIENLIEKYILVLKSQKDFQKDFQ